MASQLFASLMKRCGAPGCLQPDFHLGPHDGEIFEACIREAPKNIDSLHCLYVDSEILCDAAQQCTAANPDAMSCFTNAQQHHPSMRQYMTILGQCIPNVDAANHMTSAHAALVLSVGNMVKAGATFRVLKMGMAKSKRHNYVVLQVCMLAVDFDSQLKGYGSLLVHYLKDILTTFASSTPGSLKLMHVQADNGAVDFWSKQRFVASFRADALTNMLAAWHPSANEVYTGAASMESKAYESSQKRHFCTGRYYACQRSLHDTPH